MPTTHHCMCCTKNGLCKQHQVKCTIHPKVTYYKQDSNGFPKKCKSCIAQTLKERAIQTVATQAEADTTGSDRFTDTDASLQFPVGGDLDVSAISDVEKVTLLARGGYNSIWLVKLNTSLKFTQATFDNGGSSEYRLIDRYIVRVPGADSLLPNQVSNEVAFRRFVASKHVPVPQVYAYSATSDPETCYIAEEYIEGTPLSTIWTTFDSPQKDNIAHKLSSIVVDLAEIRFSKIGGLEPETFDPAPTVEGSKLFKGRANFHKKECYNVGPYSSTKEYMVACYDKEIYYYSNADEDDIDESLFEDTSVVEFIEQLREKCAEIEKMDIKDEPFVLVHGDLHGRNILMNGDQVAAVLDWEFAGSYPLSEVFSDGGIDVVEADSEDLEEENEIWSGKIREYIGQLVEKRGWEKADVEVLLGEGNRELAVARGEMFP